MLCRFSCNYYIFRTSLIFLSFWSFVLPKTFHVKLPHRGRPNIVFRGPSAFRVWFFINELPIYTKRRRVCVEMDIRASQYDILLFSFKRSECPSLTDVAFSPVPVYYLGRQVVPIPYKFQTRHSHILLYPRTTFSPKGRPHC